ncbi:MAG: aspartate kinase [Anaerolineales bacterium]
MKNTLVMKFGGTSVGGAPAIAQAIEIVRSERGGWQNLLVVTSAMSGVTNLLLETAQRAARGEVDGIAAAENRLREGHFSAAAALIPEESARRPLLTELGALIASFGELCRAMAVLGEASPRALDAVASLGERLSARLLAAALTAAGVAAQAVEASQLIVTDRNFQNAHPDFPASAAKTHQALIPLLERGQIPVVTGFIGATPEGALTTLGRGGSDYSAAILGALLPADEVWIWTDVDGVMTADPRLVAEARTLPEITYSEIAELAFYGAKVLHPKTVRPVLDAGIGLRICNTFNPAQPGTRLVANPPAEKVMGRQVARAVTAIRNQRLITIEGRGMLGVPGVAARAFGAVASTGTSVPLITQASSEQSICFAVPSEAFEQVLRALEAAFAVELRERDIDRIWSTLEVSIVTVVGAGMRSTPGVAGQIFSQLGRRGVNVLAIAQGSSEVSISLVIDSAETETAVRCLHELV